MCYLQPFPIIQVSGSFRGRSIYGAGEEIEKVLI